MLECRGVTGHVLFLAATWSGEKIYELECLAVLKALEHFLSSNHLIAQLTRYALNLQQFSMTIRYRPVSTKNADVLSWQSWNTIDKDVADLERGGDVKVTPEYPEETGLATKKVPSKTILCPSNI